MCLFVAIVYAYLCAAILYVYLFVAIVYVYLCVLNHILANSTNARYFTESGRAKVVLSPRSLLRMEAERLQVCVRVCVVVVEYRCLCESCIV